MWNLYFIVGLSLNEHHFDFIIGSYFCICDSSYFGWAVGQALDIPYNMTLAFFEDCFFGYRISNINP